ncbi:hypothetical protein D3C81_1614380 [compost metagenome]
MQDVTADAVAHQGEGDDHQHQLHQNGQHQRRQVDPAEAWDHFAQRIEQRLGGAHDELAERVVEVGAHQLQDEAQQDDQQVEAAQGLDDVDGSGGKAGH